eukprot:GDKK01008525.1.p1 GENE.GDKK01008525.1~~GDKK01008525.1.p1  ORF type:complete len:154 (+),score=3.75 GDKK01008525.1:67-462(+)
MCLRVVRALISKGDFQSQARIIEEISCQWGSPRRGLRASITETSEHHAKLIAEAVMSAYRSTNESFDPQTLTMESQVYRVVKSDSPLSIQPTRPLVHDLPTIDSYVVTNQNVAKSRPISAPVVKTGFNSPN